MPPRRYLPLTLDCGQFHPRMGGNSCFALCIEKFVPEIDVVSFLELLQFEKGKMVEIHEQMDKVRTLCEMLDIALVVYTAQCNEIHFISSDYVFRLNEGCSRVLTLMISNNHFVQVIDMIELTDEQVSRILDIDFDKRRFDEAFLMSLSGE